LIEIKDITLGQFAPRDSVIHGLDPRLKILSSLFFMLLLLFTNSITVLFWFFVVVIVLYRAAQIPISNAFGNLRAFLVLFILTFLLHGFLTSGRILFRVPYLGAVFTYEGMAKGFFYTFRICVLIVLANLLTLTTSPMSLTDAFTYFLKPFRKLGVPAHEIGMMISIALRFIPIFIDESDRIKKAQISRGARFEGGFVRKIKNISSLIIPLFVSTFRRANDLAFAMESRCYRGSEGRTSYYILKFKRNDLIAFFCMIFIGVPVFLFR
jgi:energy-coupling factor transport system permease protein